MKILPVNALPSHIVQNLNFYEWRHLYNSQTPYLLKGICSHWDAVKKWRDFQYLKEKAGKSMIEVEVGNTYLDHNLEKCTIELGEYLDYLEAGENATNNAKHGIPALRSEVNQPTEGTQRSKELRREIRRLQNETPIKPTDYQKSPPVYFAQYDVRTIHQLNSDYSNPTLTKTGKGSLYKVNIWMGLHDTKSPCHFDPFNNVLCQVYGTKRVIVVSPEYTRNLYPFYGSIALKNTSQVDIEAPDLLKFPLFEKCYGFEAELEPGDGIFIPLRWWHYCAAKTHNCSINFWWL